MSRPDFSLTWASSRLSIPAISGPDYALGFANYLGSQPPTTDDHDYIMNLQDRRAVWLGGQMLLTVGHEWQSNVTYNAFAVVRSPVNGQLYRSLVGSNLNNEPSVSGAQWALGVAQSADLLNTTRIDVASASTVNLTTAAPSTRNINITGTTTITTFTVAAGQLYFVRFNAALTLTNGAGLVTQTGANLVTAAGDTCILRATAANVVEVLCYVRAVQAYTSPQQAITLAGLTTLSHGLSSPPRWHELRLVCVTADQGYSPDDEVIQNPGLSSVNGSTGFSIVTTSTQLLVRVSSAAPLLINKTSGAAAPITIANWRFVLRAFA